MCIRDSANGSPLALGIGDFPHDLQIAGLEVVLGLHIGEAVSYTHLDVYKRQLLLDIALFAPIEGGGYEYA